MPRLVLPFSSLSIVELEEYITILLLVDLVHVYVIGLLELLIVKPFNRMAVNKLKDFFGK